MTSERIASGKPSSTRLSLMQKGLLIVGIPFLCQLFIIGLLLHEVQKSEAESATEARAKDIVDQTQRVTESCYGVVFAAWNCRDTSRSSAENLIKALGTLPTARDSLRTTMQAQRGDSAEYEKISSSLDGLTGEFSHWRQVVADASLNDKNRLLVAFDDPKVRQSLTTQLEQVARGLNEINRRSDTIRASSPARQISVQSEMQFISIIGGIAIVFFGMGLVLFFSRSITSRVRIITENSQKLASGLPLNPPLRGNDEISEVDAVFHRMAETLRQARAKEQELIDNAQEVICSLDRNSNFVRLNPACKKQWGFEPAQLTGTSVRAIIEDRDASATCAALQATREGNPVRSFESRVLRQDGTSIDVVWSVCWSEVEQLLFCVVHDITERKEAERLRQDFFAMVSHDLKAPLASVMVAHELVMEGMYGELSELAADKLDTANKNLSRLVKLVNDLLDLEKLEAGQMPVVYAPLSLSQLIQQSVSAVDNLAVQQGVRIETHCPDITIEADNDRLEQVVVNLLSNAIKSTPPGGLVAVDVSQPNLGFIQIAVTDGGPVVQEANREHIFDRFGSVSASGAGMRRDTNLALAISKAIIESHRGNIGVRPASDSGNSGNRFWISLPISAHVQSPASIVAKDLVVSA